MLPSRNNSLFSEGQIIYLIWICISFSLNNYGQNITHLTEKDYIKYELIENRKKVDSLMFSSSSYFTINSDGFVYLKNLNNIESLWIENLDGLIIISNKDIANSSRIDFRLFPSGNYILKMRTKKALVFKYYLTKN